MTKTKALVKFDFDVAVITALDERYKGIQTAEGTKNLALVMKGLSEYREIRLAIDDQHKKLKTDILLAGRSLDGDKTRLKTLIQPGESRLRDFKNAEDDRKDAIREEKAAKERERIEAIQEKINWFSRLSTVQHNVSSSTIEETLVLLKGAEISEEVYMEFTQQAMQAHKASITALNEILTERLQFEKEMAERDAESERLEELRKKLEVVQKKAKEENKKIEEQKYNIAQEITAEQQRKDREEFERQAKEKAEAAAAQKLKDAASAEEERVKMAAAEKARQEALKPDRDKIYDYANALMDICTAQVKSDKAREVLAWASNETEKLANKIREKAEKL